MDLILCNGAVTNSNSENIWSSEMTEETAKFPIIYTKGDNIDTSNNNSMEKIMVCHDSFLNYMAVRHLIR